MQQTLAMKPRTANTLVSLGLFVVFALHLGPAASKPVHADNDHQPPPPPPPPSGGSPPLWSRNSTDLPRFPWQPRNSTELPPPPPPFGDDDRARRGHGPPRGGFGGVPPAWLPSNSTDLPPRQQPPSHDADGRAPGRNQHPAPGPHVSTATSDVESSIKTLGRLGS